MKRAVLVLAAMALVGCPAKPGVGTSCRTHDDCSAIENGWCAKVEICTRACDEAAPCPTGSACIVEGSRQVCLPLCVTLKDCAPGFACNAVSDVGSVCEYADPLGPPPSP